MPSKSHPTTDITQEIYWRWGKMEKAASKQRKQRDQASMAQTLSGYAACAQENTRKWKCEALLVRGPWC